MTINDLYTNRAKAWEDAKAFLDAHATDNGTLSASDAEVYDRMEREITALSDQIARVQRLSDMESEMRAPVSAPIVGTPGAGAPDSKTGRASDEYRRDFDAMLRGKLPMRNALVEGTGSAGGYLVPEEFENQIITGLDEFNVVRGVANVIRTNGDHKIPVATKHSTAQWKGEGVAYAESDPEFGQITLSAHKLTDLVKVSIELLQDSMFDLDSYITGEFARAFGIAEEEGFCVGTGSGQPTGIFTANGGEVGHTAGAADKITPEDIISLIYKLKAPYRAAAKWLMNDSTVAAVRKLKDANGVYMWQPSFAMGEPDKLVGYELLTSAYAPEIAASANVAAFGDFHCYWIADRMGITVQRLNEAFATNGQVGFIATERVDGKVVLAEGIQLLKMHA